MDTWVETRRIRSTK
ncbi:hypothetical protein [Rhodobacter lacus]|uniref:Uncharacterized protein n=1 Tax=Rhodobacter lacus TaxID=1641972 RepID=A0ABW5ACL7_9RHOB